MPSINLSEQIIDKFKGVFNSKIPHLIIYGGRGKTATSFMSFKVGLDVLNNDTLGSSVVMRRYTNKIRRSVFPEIKKAYSRMGLLEGTHYRSRLSPFEIRINSNNNKIFFTGVESIDDIKGMVDDDRPIKRVWIEELTEFFDKSLEDGEEMLSNIEATFSRGNNDYFQMCYTFNPPRNPNHPVMRWLKKMEQRKDCITVQASYLDVPRQWLGEAFIKQAEALKEADEELYRNVYLGECVGSRGRIYQIKPTAIKDSKKDYDFFTMAIDIGESKSATTFCLTGFKYIGGKLTAQIVREYHHRNVDYREVDTKEFDDYAEDFVRFYNKAVIDYGKHPREIRIDHDVMFAKALKRAFNQNRLDFSKVFKAKKLEINDRIKAVKLMLALDQLSFSKEVPITINAFQEALWDEKLADKGIDQRLDNLTTNIDSLDCAEYSLEPFFDEMVKIRK